MKTKHQIIFAILIAFAVISFWRGVLGLMDLYLFPNNNELSLWFSLIIGLLILIFTNYATKELM
jgi:hypothetical protein